MTIHNFIWDEWNVEHIARHRVSAYEVEGVCGSRKIFITKVGGQKIRVIGQALSGRYLTIFLANKGEGYYVVTARDATMKEKRQYKRRYK